MENLGLRARFKKAQDSVVERVREDKKCLAALVLGSMSHDLIWEWSDLEILLIYGDSYKGPRSYSLLENEVHVVVNIRRKGEFLDYLGSSDVSDYWFCALSKSKLLYSRDGTLSEQIEDAFYVGERDREVEMLLGFSQAIYYLNKAEKNFQVKGNVANAVYFIPHIAEGIAWLEVARSRAIREREIIAQASELKPELFERIYHRLYSQVVTAQMVDEILVDCHEYLVENTWEVYRPILSYLRTHGTLQDFSMPVREHGFGINYDWLYRVGIVERYAEPMKISSASFYQLGYRIRDEYR